MNKLLTKIVGVALGATMAVGVGVAAVKASDGGMQRAEATAADLSGWTTSGTGTYSDGSIKFDGSGDSIQKADLFSGTVTSLTITVNCKSNGGPAAGNVYTASAIDSSGTVLASATKSGADITTSYSDMVFSLSSGISTATGIKLVYTTKASGGGNWGIKSVDYIVETSGGGESLSGTGTINFGNNGTKINATSVSGKDDLNVTWTVATVGTTSFTQAASYSQVGSGSNPASSISLTASLGSEYTITSFSGKFGGFNGTAGSVTFEVGSTTVATGSLNASSDVLISSSSSGTGSNLSVTISDIAKGVKIYYLSYTLEGSEPTETYTVSFNSNGGTGTMTDVPGVSGSYTLPANKFTAPEGKKFAGWKAENLGDLILAGSTYTVTEDVTFYAQWANAWSVTYDANGGSGTMTDSNSPYTDGATVTVLANSFIAPAGYLFSHWNTSDDDAGTSYDKDDQFVISSNVILYAIWEEKADNQVVITMDKTTGLSNSYSEGTWADGDVSGKVFAIKKTTEFQFSKSSGTSYFYNVDAIPGPITNISLNKSSGSYRSIELFLGTEKMTTKPSSGGISNNTTWSWDVDPDDEFTFFYFWNSDSSAAYFDTVTITFKKVSLVDPTGITLDDDSPVSMDTYGYGNRQLAATVEPFNANDKTVTWGSNNASVVTIDGGVLTPVAPGSTTVYAHTANYDSEHPDADLIKTVSVTVTQAAYKKATFTPTSATSAEQSDDYLSSGSVTLESNAFDSVKSATQVASGKTATFTVSGYDDKEIVGIDLVMSSNANAGAGSLDFSINSSTVFEIEAQAFSGEAWNGEFSANPVWLYRAVTSTTVEAGEDIVFTFSGVVNSLYVHSVSIRYIDSESSELETWCQDFLNNYTCDATGNTAPSTSDWDDFGLDFLSLSPELQLEAKNADANESGNVIERAMAKYDYIMSKYGELEDEHSVKLYDNFIQRTVHPLGTNKIITKTVNNTVAIVVVVTISLVSVSALGAYFLLRKKKEER